MRKKICMFIEILLSISTFVFCVYNSFRVWFCRYEPTSGRAILEILLYKFEITSLNHELNGCRNTFLLAYSSLLFLVYQ